jgi:hypothetical protein
MGMSSTTISVGGRTIMILRCAATEALDLELSIARVLGSSDVAAAQAAMGGDFKSSVAFGLIEMVSGAAKNLTLAELTRLMELLFKYIMIDGKSFRDINEDFADRPGDVWRVFIAAVKHNLGPLGDVLPKKPATNLTQTIPSSNP